MVVALTAFGLAGTPAPAAAEQSAPERRTARFEINFLTTMIDHHAMAVAMAELCLGRAVHPDLETLCEDVMAAQSAEVREMQRWLQDWYGVTHEPAMSPADMQMMARLASRSGAQFEIEFMQALIVHHRAALEEAGKCLRRAGHHALEDLCRNIVETQSAEIVQLEQWLCRWYDRCRHRGHYVTVGRAPASSAAVASAISVPSSK